MKKIIILGYSAVESFYFPTNKWLEKSVLMTLKAYKSKIRDKTS